MSKKSVLILAFMLFLLWAISSGKFEATIQCGLAADGTQRIRHIPSDFTSIQAAIDNASSGDTIVVAPGTYSETLSISKSLTIIGEDRDTTIVDGQGVGDAISIRSDSVTITGLTVMSNGTGIRRNAIAVDHHGGIIVDATKLAGSYYALSLAFCSNSIFSNNVIINNTFGIELINTNNNVFSNNTISGNGEGIAFDYINNLNVFFGNTFLDNIEGAAIRQSSYENSFYHNNFLDQITIETGGTNFWNRSDEGNYWSSYKGQDFYSGQYQNETGSDGIGDEPYTLGENNYDEYPLMGVFSEFNVSLPYDETENVAIISNSTVSNLNLLTWLSSPHNGLQPGQSFIQFTATGENGTVGFCRLMIPRTALNGSSYIVLFDDQPISATELPFSNSSHVYLYFTYTHSTHEVIVTIPEYAAFLIPPIFMIATLLAIIVYKRKHLTRA